MKVWIVFGGVDHEGDTVLGVFDSEESAAVAIVELNRENDGHFWRIFAEVYTVGERERLS